MQILFQRVQNCRRGLGRITRVRLPGDHLSSIWIGSRILRREVHLEITQQVNRHCKFLVRLLRYPIPGLSRRL